MKPNRKRSASPFPLSEVKQTAAVAGQNNGNPQAIFNGHMLVNLKIDGVFRLYDPSYGVVYDDLSDFEIRAVAYYGVRAAPAKMADGKNYASGYLVKTKTATLNVSRVDIPALKDY